jgi:hypothetical protein
LIYSTVVFKFINIETYLCEKSMVKVAC